MDKNFMAKTGSAIAALRSLRFIPKPFRIYWGVYGGFWALLRSPYLWLSIILTVLCAPLWEWWPSRTPIAPMLISMIPIAMAFTIIAAGIVFILMATAIMPALLRRDILSEIREAGDDRSLLMSVASIFCHFALVQALALAMSLLSATYPREDFFNGAAFFLTIYGMMAVLSIAAMLINLARICNSLEAGDLPGSGVPE